MSEQKILYGWFSGEHAKKFGYSIYSCPIETDPSGKVMITCADYSPKCDGYLWLDKIYVGIIWKQIESVPGTIMIK